MRATWKVSAVAAVVAAGVLAGCGDGDGPVIGPTAPPRSSSSPGPVASVTGPPLTGTAPTGSVPSGTSGTPTPKVIDDSNLGWTVFCDPASRPAPAGDLARVFGPLLVSGGECFVVNFALNEGFSPELMETRAAGQAARDVAVVDRFLTPGAAKRFHASVSKALAGDKAEMAQVRGLVGFAEESTKVQFREGEPRVSDQSFRVVRTWVEQTDPLWRSRLGVGVEVSAVLHLVRASDEAPVVRKVTKRMRVLLVNNEHGAAATGPAWSIDDWSTVSEVRGDVAVKP